MKKSIAFLALITTIVLAAYAYQTANEGSMISFTYAIIPAGLLCLRVS